jgi:hypothetical protein
MRYGSLYSALSVTSWLASLSVISLCIWIVLSGSRRSTNENVTTKGLYSIPKVRPRGEITIWIGSMLMVLAIGLALGYGARDHELGRNTRTYTDVVVISRFSPRDFSVWPDRMKQQRIQICPESVVDWREGEVLADWTFEQKPGCKRVISYHEKPKGEVNASIQMR